MTRDLVECTAHVEVPGLDRLAASCASGVPLVLALFPPLLRALVRLLGHLSGDGDVVVADPTLTWTEQPDRWPRSTRLTTTVGLRPAADARSSRAPAGTIVIAHDHYNPRDGDGWSVTLDLRDLPVAGHPRARASLRVESAGWTGEPHPLTVHVVGLSPEQRDQVIAILRQESP
jgi:hypothetical protein